MLLGICNDTTQLKTCYFQKSCLCCALASMVSSGCRHRPGVEPPAKLLQLLKTLLSADRYLPHKPQGNWQCFSRDRIDQTGETGFGSVHLLPVFLQLCPTCTTRDENKAVGAEPTGNTSNRYRSTEKEHWGTSY